MNTNELHCQLIIHGYDCDAETITSSIGIKPTSVIEKGSIKNKHATAPILWDTNYWIFEIESFDDIYPEQLLAQLIDRVYSHKNDFVKLSKQYSTELSLYGTVYKPHVGAHIDIELLRKISELNIEFDISFYALTPDFLGDKGSIDTLALRLLETGIYDSTQAHLVSEALAMFESQSEEINDSLLQDLVDDEADVSDMTEALKQIKKKLASIEQGLKKSKLLG